MRSATDPNRVGYCSDCWQPDPLCLCPEPVTVSIQVLIVRHWKEAWKSSNTGRLAQLAIHGAKILDYGAPGQTFDEAPLKQPNTWLLFPPARQTDPNGTCTEPPSSLLMDVLDQGHRIDRLVVIDASWPQARKLARRIPSLSQLPRVQVRPPETPPVRLRKPPFPKAMATLEAIARAVEQIDGPAAAHPLDVLFNRFVKQSRARSGRPPH